MFVRASAAMEPTVSGVSLLFLSPFPPPPLFHSCFPVFLLLRGDKATQQGEKRSRRVDPLVVICALYCLITRSSVEPEEEPPAFSRGCAAAGCQTHGPWTKPARQVLLVTNLCTSNHQNSHNPHSHHDESLCTLFSKKCSLLFCASF